VPTSTWRDRDYEAGVSGPTSRIYRHVSAIKSGVVSASALHRNSRSGEFNADSTTGEAGPRGRRPLV